MARNAKSRKTRKNKPSAADIAKAKRSKAARKGWRTRIRNQEIKEREKQQRKRKRERKKRIRKAKPRRQLRDYLVFIRYKTREGAARTYSRDVIVPAPAGTPAYKIKRIASEVLRDYIGAHAGREPHIISIKSERRARKGSPIIAEIEVIQGPETRRKKAVVR